MLTSRPNSPVYCWFVLKARAVRIVVTVCSVAATLALPMLPPEHMHETYSGRPILHRHIIDEPAEHAGAIDHGDHHGVKTLEPTFVSERQYNIAGPLMSVALVIIAPERRLVGRPEAIDAPVAHAPPIRLDSLPAPPA